MKKVGFLKFNWKEMGEEKNISLFHFIYSCRKTVDYSKSVLNKEFLGFLIEFKENSLRYYFVPGSIVSVGKIALKKIKTNPRFIKVVEEDFIKSHKQAADFAKRIHGLSLSKKTNKELYFLHLEFQKLVGRAHKYGWLFQYVEFEEPLLSGQLKKYLEEQSKKVSVSLSPIEYLTILTTPSKKTQARRQEEDLLKLAIRVKKSKKLSNLFKLSGNQISKRLPQVCSSFNKVLEAHVNKYRWLPWAYEGPLFWDKNHFISSIAKLVRKSVNLEAKYREYRNEKRELRKKQKQIFKDIKIDSHYQHLFNVAQTAMHLKAYRKEIFFTKALYFIDKLLDEITYRLNINKKQFRTMRPEEVKEALCSRKLDLAEINKRIKHCVWICLRGNKEWIFSGEEATKIIQKIKGEIRIKDKVTELGGQCACPGKAKGIVKQISEFRDIPKMRKGDILIASATNPDIVLAMKKAAAIVTDRGGLTCHAAIVSRELNVPCIIGTKIATKALKDGDEVEVDANKGIVKILKRAS